MAVKPREKAHAEAEIMPSRFENEFSAELTDPWGGLLSDVTLVPQYTRDAVVDVETIPISIRGMLDVAFARYYQVIKLDENSYNDLPENSPKWHSFDAKSSEKAEEFIKLAKAYGRHRPEARGGQMSVRAFRPSKTVDGQRVTTTVVKFTAMPLVKSEPRNPSQNTSKIREWARENGHELKDRGRIPAEILSAYRDANPDE